MNYRRGLQRVYLVLTVAWFLLVLLMVVSNRWVWEPWQITPSYAPDWFTQNAPHAVDYTALAKEAGAISSQPANALPPPPPGYTIDSTRVDSGASRLPPGAKLVSGSVPQQPSAIGVSTFRKVIWITWLSLPMPVIGYLLLFHVSRWVYRGFRPGTQI